MNLTRIALAALACFGLSAPAVALDFTMDFDNIPTAGTPEEGPNSERGSDILGYYNGDSGPAPTFPRQGNQLWDVTFAQVALAIASADAGGFGNFDKAYSGDSAAGSLRDDGVHFELSQGLYLANLGLWYNAGGPGSNPGLQLFSSGVNVFSEALTLCTTTGEDGFCGWVEFQLPAKVLLDFASQGKPITEVTLGGTGNRVVYDNVALSTTPVPEPSTYALALLGLAFIAVAARRRRAG